MKQAYILAIFAAAAMTDAAALPQTSAVTMTQRADNSVEISYELSGAPAIVTLDIQTNGVSIGGKHLQCFSPESAVWKKVATDGQHKIVWHPSRSWEGNLVDSGARAVVTAWAPGTAPDYLVVDISNGAKQNTQRYYPSEAHLPGGLLANPAYRTTLLAMRRIHAKGRHVASGSTVELGRSNENMRKAVLTNDYYIGVFEVTAAQWLLVGGRNTIDFTSDGKGAMRPAEGMRPCEIRWNASNTYHYNTLWPSGPYATSWIGKLNSLTGLDFDLPSEAQWEYAARAGHPECEQGDGTPITSNTSYDGLPGCYASNADGAPAVCGSYNANDFGLYDMVGNVWEACLDWWEQNPQACTSWINIDSANPQNAFDGTAVGKGSAGAYTGTTVVKGGGWKSSAESCRSACRTNVAQNGGGTDIGFRLVCRAGLD